MVTIYVRDGESLDQALKRFKQAVVKERIHSEVRKRRFYLSKSEKKRRKEHIAFLRWLKRKKKYENQDSETEDKKVIATERRAQARDNNRNIEQDRNIDQSRQHRTQDHSTPQSSDTTSSSKHTRATVDKPGTTRSLRRDTQKRDSTQRRTRRSIQTRTPTNRASPVQGNNRPLRKSTH